MASAEAQTSQALHNRVTPSAEGLTPSSAGNGRAARLSGFLRPAKAAQIPSAQAQTTEVTGVTVGPAAERFGPSSASERRSSWRSRLVTGLMLAVGVTVLALGFTVRAASLHLNTVLSNSMQPSFSAGDLVVTRTVPTGSLQVGDVITFVQPGTARPLIHRISSLQDGVITTRGDANPVDDPWRLTLTGTTADRLVAVVPYLGWLTQLQRPALLLAGALIGLLIVLELGKEVGKRLGKKRTQRQS